MGSASSRVVILDKNIAQIQRKWPLFQSQFCFGLNCLTDANLLILISFLINLFPVLQIDTNIGRSCCAHGHENQCHNTHYGNYDPTHYCLQSG